VATGGKIASFSCEYFLVTYSLRNPKTDHLVLAAWSFFLLRRRKMMRESETSVGPFSFRVSVIGRFAPKGGKGIEFRLLAGRPGPSSPGPLISEELAPKMRSVEGKFDDLHKWARKTYCRGLRSLLFELANSYLYWRWDRLLHKVCNAAGKSVSVSIRRYLDEEFCWYP
jgi:hypothetical protein